MDAELVTALRAGLGAFHEWRGKHPETALDLTGADLTGIDLASRRTWPDETPSGESAIERERLAIYDRALDMVEAAGITEYSRPRQVANLSGATFTGARLDRAKLRGAILRDAQFQDTRLVEADLSDADLEEADFTRADLTGASLARARVSGTVFDDASVKGISLHAAVDFPKSQWHDVGKSRLGYRKNLDGRDFEGAILREIDFTKVSFRGANLRGCNMSDSNFTDAFLEGAQLDEIAATEARFVRAELGDARFHRARLGKAIFEGAHADDANFSGAELIGCSFVNASLEGADFTGATLNTPDFTGANVRWARFESAILTHPKAFLPDQTFSTAVIHATPPQDPWSTLRFRYTGIRFALNLLLVGLFLLPYVARAVMWLGVHAAESRFLDERTGKLRIELGSTSEWLKALSTLPDPELLGVRSQDKLQRDLIRHREVALSAAQSGIPLVDRAGAEVVQAIDALRAFSPRQATEAREDLDRWRQMTAQAAERLSRLTQPWEPVALWTLVMPSKSARLILVLTLVVALYNVVRAVLTVRVGTLRDQELLTSCSPAKAQYLPLFKLNQVATVLFYAAVLALVVNTYEWMTTIVWMPPS